MRYFLLLLILLLLFPVQANFFKESYSPGETVQLEIEIDLDIVGDLESRQASILNSIGEELRVQVKLLKIEKDHYLAYFDLPGNTEVGSYTFQINNIRYMENGQLKFTDIAREFSVELNDYDRIRILPGAALYREGEATFLKFRISNLEERAVSFMLSSTTILTPTVNLLQIPGRSIKTFYILINPSKIISSGIELFEFEDYVIPFYLDKASCTPDWRCSDWGSCVNGFVTRSCSDVNNCGEVCSGDLCKEERECEVCNPNWECVDYGECQDDVRDCDDVADVNGCGEGYFGDYSEFDTIACNVCVSEWRCNSWGECVDGDEKRDCVDVNNCGEVCSGDLCKEERECEVLVTDSGEIFSIVFFDDINNPEVTINSLVNPELNEKQDLSGRLYIKNTGNAKLTNIRFQLTGNLNDIVKIGIVAADELDIEEVMSQTINVNENKNPRQDEYRGELIFSSTQLSESFSMIFVIEREKVISDDLAGRDKETLFTEEIVPLSEDEIEFPFQDVRQDEVPMVVPKKELPYRVIVSILVIVLVIIIYFIIKKSTKRKISFKDYISKIEKK